MSLAQQNKINIYIYIYFRKKNKKQVDTLIFPNEDFIYGMQWRKKKKNTTILQIYLYLQKEVGKTNILIRELFLKDFKMYFVVHFIWVQPQHMKYNGQIYFVFIYYYNHFLGKIANLYLYVIKRSIGFVHNFPKIVVVFSCVYLR